jgi:LuxR family maltose regulon positive regulatory protein
LPRCPRCIAASRAQVWLRRAEAEHDSRWLDLSLRWAAKQQIDWAAPDEAGCWTGESLTHARVLIAQRRLRSSELGSAGLEPLLRYLDELYKISEEHGWAELMIDTSIVQAMAWQAVGQVDQASDALARALLLSEPERYMRVFLDEGPPMARLLYRALDGGAAPDHARRLLNAYGEISSEQEPRAERRAPDLIEPLSEREIEVLQLIAEGLTNREVGQRLFITQGTVKAHTSNIYGKLGVHNRTRAVAQARALGVLPST